MISPAASPCPCNSTRPYGDCCGRFLGGGQAASSAEQLMRSRYVAFVHRDADYLLATLAPENAGGFDKNAVRKDRCRWMGLEILAVEKGGILDQAGFVEFVATYRDGGREYRLHEKSRFERRAGKWLYIDGVFPDQTPLR